MDKLPLCQLNGLSNNGTIVQLSGVPQSQQYISTMSCVPWSSMEKHLSDDQSLPHSDPTKNKIIFSLLTANFEIFVNPMVVGHVDHGHCMVKHEEALKG